MDAVKLPDKLRVWIVAKDISVRARLREAFASILFKPSITPFPSPKQVDVPIDAILVPEIVVLALSLGKEELERLSTLFKSAEMKDRAPAKVIVAIDGRGNLESSQIVGLYLHGIDGFVSEPYSIQDLQLLLNGLFNTAEKSAPVKRTLRSAVFVLRDSMQYIDQLAQQIYSGEEGAHPARKELVTISETLRNLREQDPAEYEKAVLESFSNIAPPRTSEVKRIKSTKVEKLPHPGAVIKQVMQDRGFDAEKLALQMRLPPGEFALLLEEKAPLTEMIAEALSRGLGRSPREWLALQKNYDKQEEAAAKKGSKRK